MAFGLGAVVERSIAVFTVIKIIGAAYLIFLGVQAIRHRRRLSAALAAEVVPTSTRRILGQGMLVGLTNPKGFLILAAVLPQFVDPAAGHVWLQMLQLVAVCIMMAVVTDSCWALLAGTARSWFIRSPRRLETVGGASGLIMIGLGIRLAVTGRKD